MSDINSEDKILFENISPPSVIMEDEKHVADIIKYVALKTITETKNGTYNNVNKEIQYDVHIGDKTFLTSISCGEPKKDNYYIMVLFLRISVFDDEKKISLRMYTCGSSEFFDDDNETCLGYDKVYNNIAKRISYCDCKEENIINIGSCWQDTFENNWQDNISELLNNVLTPSNIKLWIGIKICLYCNDRYNDIENGDSKMCWRCKVNNEVMRAGRPSLDKCCICYEDISYLDCAKVCLDIRHTIHQGCYNMLRVIANGESISCPICRQNYSSE